MLSPIAHHQRHPQHHQRQHHRPKHRLPSPGRKVPHGDVHGVATILPERRLGRLLVASLAREIQRQIQPHQEIESADVLGKLAELIALVPDRRRQIIRPVALDVVVLDVVVVVRVPGVAHQGIQNIGKHGVEYPRPPFIFGQDATHVDVLVHHQRVGAHVPAVEDGVEDGVRPGEADKEEIHGGRDSGGKVDEEVGDHQNVGWYADEGGGPLLIGGEEGGREPLEGLQVGEVEEVGNGGFKGGGFGVVEGGEMGDGCFVAGGCE